MQPNEPSWAWSLWSHSLSHWVLDYVDVAEITNPCAHATCSTSIPSPVELQDFAVGSITGKEEPLAVDSPPLGSDGFRGAQNASFDSSANSRIAERCGWRRLDSQRFYLNVFSCLNSLQRYVSAFVSVQWIWKHFLSHEPTRMQQALTVQ